MAKLAFVDTETTGLDPDRHEIWEVALLLADSGDLTDTRECVWQLPVDLTVADPMGLRVSGYHDRHVHGYGNKVPPKLGDGPTQPLVFADEFCRLTYQAHMVGAVPSFDDERLRKLLARWGYAAGWHYHLIDVEAMAVGYQWGASAEAADRDTHEQPGGPVRAPHEYCANTVALPWRSDDLSRACGVEPPSEDERHTALGDARWAYRWYRALVGVSYG